MDNLAPELIDPGLLRQMKSHQPKYRVDAINKQVELLVRKAAEKKEKQTGNKQIRNPS